MDTEERVAEMGEAFGAMGECVMSLYGIARLLGSRSVSAAKITPAIEGFRASESAHCRQLEQGLAEIAVASVSSRSLSDAVELLRDEARSTTAQIHDLLDELGRLAARERLTVERGVRRLGARLDALRWLATVVRASLRPRPALVGLNDVFAGDGVIRRAFVVDHLEVMLPCGGRAEISGDPIVLRALMEQALLEVRDAGVEAPFAQVSVGDHGPRIELGAAEPIHCTTIERVVLPLGVPLGCEREILDAVGATAGVSTEPSSDGQLMSVLLHTACA